MLTGVFHLFASLKINLLILLIFLMLINFVNCYICSSLHEAHDFFNMTKVFNIHFYNVSAYDVFILLIIAEDGSKKSVYLMKTFFIKTIIHVLFSMFESH